MSITRIYTGRVIGPNLIGTLKILLRGTALCPSVTMNLLFVTTSISHLSQSIIDLLTIVTPEPVFTTVVTMTSFTWYVAVSEVCSSSSSSTYLISVILFTLTTSDARIDLLSSL